MDQDQKNESENEFCFIRAAKKEDMETVQKLIQELADFENMSDGPKLTAEDLIRDSGLNDGNGTEFFHCYVAEIHKSYNTLMNRPLTREIVGYAICFFSYSTWEGRTYFLEDLYVQPNYRKKGIGRLLFQHVIEKAKYYNCPKIDFHVLNWNPAKKFYIKMGAVNLTETENWQFFRLRI